MVERVAEALWSTDRHRAIGKHARTTWAEWADEDKQKWRELAATAIAAMREPTEAMLGTVATVILGRIAHGAHAPLPWEEGYRIMIDAALNASPQYQVADDALEKIRKKDSSGRDGSSKR